MTKNNFDRFAAIFGERGGGGGGGGVHVNIIYIGREMQHRIFGMRHRIGVNL